MGPPNNDPTAILVSMRIEARMREAAQHRLARAVAEGAQNERPLAIRFRPLIWVRQIALRVVAPA